MEPTVVAVDFVIVVAASLLAGIGYSWFSLDVIPETVVQTYPALGVLAFTNVCAVLAARGDYQVCNLVRLYHQARDLVIIWTSVSLLLLGVAFSLKLGESLPRGAILVFFALSLGSMIVWRGLLAQFLEQALSAGAFAPRNVILIGEQNRLPTSDIILEMRRCGYTPIQTFEIGQEEFTTLKFHRGYAQHSMGRSKQRTESVAGRPMGLASRFLDSRLDHRAARYHWRDGHLRMAGALGDQ